MHCVPPALKTSHSAPQRARSTLSHAEQHIRLSSRKTFPPRHSQVDTRSGGEQSVQIVFLLLHCRCLLLGRRSCRLLLLLAAVHIDAQVLQAVAERAVS